MKKYKATFWRSNPQLSSGGYQTTRIIEAKTIRSAEKKARELADKVVYGGMRLTDIWQVTEEEARA